MRMGCSVLGRGFMLYARAFKAIQRILIGQLRSIKYLSINLAQSVQPLETTTSNNATAKAYKAQKSPLPSCTLNYDLVKPSRISQGL